MTDLLEARPTTGQATSRTIPHGTNTGYKYWKCRCLPCADAAAAYQARRYRRQGAGVWKPFTDTTRAVAHINHLRKKGMAVTQIVAACGIPHATLDRIRGVSAQPTIRRIRPETEARILAVRFDVERVTRKAYVPVRGAVRRIQALRAHGWPVHEIAARCGVDPRTVVALTNQKVMYAETFRAVRLAYEDLHDQDPTRYGIRDWVVARTRRESRQAGFAPPSAWADIDTNPQPAQRSKWAVRYAKAVPGEASAALLEQVRELVDQGEVRPMIEARTGKSWATITTAFNRAGFSVPEVTA